MDVKQPDRDDEQVRHPGQIGTYLIQHVIGVGGMATVYAALQQNPRRTVALKVLRPMAVTQATLRRFKQEAQILAKLRHPYIAQVYEAGTFDDGGGAVPYFVMEYIPGALTIIEFAEQKKLDQRERLKLFAKVCAAVQHGHALKVVHRDLKPGNILVDRAGDPKVIDFGVARSIDFGVAGQTMVTDAGRIVGTVQYMGPEQVQVSPQDIDARADVYALGVVLYKLVCGRHPFELAGTPLHEAVRIIREDAPKPPSQASPDVKGDLETIILKALEKDPLRRYSNAGSLGRDVIRYLADEPIKARRASLFYRARLFARRNRARLFAAGSLGIAIAAVIGSALYVRGFDRMAGVPQAENPPTTAPLSPVASSPQSRDITDPFAIVRHDGAITCIAISSNGSRIATASLDGRVRVADPVQRTEIATLDDQTLGPRVGVTGDGEGLMVVINHSEVAQAGGSQRSLRRIGLTHSAPVTDLIVAPDGSTISASEDITVRVLRVDEKEPVVLRGSAGAFRSLAVDENMLAAGTDRGSVELWAYPSFKSRGTIGRAGFRVTCLRLVGESSLLVGLGDGTLRRWNFDGSEAWQLRAHPRGLTGMAISPLRPVVATVSGDGAPRFWNYESGSEIEVPKRTWTPEIEGASAIAWDPLDRWIVVGDRSGLVMVLPVPAALPTPRSE